MTVAAHDEIYRVVQHWQLHAQNCYNVIHFRADGTPDIETGLIAGVRSAFVTSLAGSHFSNDLLLKDVMCYRIYPSLSRQYIQTYTDAGTINGDSIPSTAAVVAQIRTAEGGRRARGRFYVPGIGVSVCNDSRFTAGTFTYLANLVASFITPASAPRWRIGVLSRVLAGSSIPVNPAGFKLATSLTFDPVIATMRTRRIGRGR